MTNFPHAAKIRNMFKGDIINRLIKLHVNILYTALLNFGNNDNQTGVMWGPGGREGRCTVYFSTAGSLISLELTVHSIKTQFTWQT